jgi:hypothetical protein
MFVKNKASIDFKYRKSGYLAVLKAGTVSYVDENKITAKELLGCYGQRIDIISRDLVEEIAPHVVKEEVKEAIKKEAPKATEAIKKEELNDSFIEKVLGEIEGEVKKEEAPTPEADENKEEVYKDVAQQVVAFLNGELDEFPEGAPIMKKAEVEEAGNTESTKTTKAKAPSKSKAKATKTATSKPRAKRGSKTKA